MSDAWDANPAGGLDIRFYGRSERRAGSPEVVLAAPLDFTAVYQLLLSLNDRRFLPFDSSYPNGEALESLAEGPMRLTALEHRTCHACEVRYWAESDDPYSDVQQRYDPSLHFVAAALADELSSRTELLLDFICALIQGYDRRDWSWWFKQEPGTCSNESQRASLEEHVSLQLMALGWRLVDGYPVEISGDMTSMPTPDDWPSVWSALNDAKRETAAGRFGDAATDLGTALSAALAAAGCDGDVLGKQLTSARKMGLLDREHSKLGEAASAIGDWLAAIRNQKSDSHPGDEAVEHEVGFALSVVPALCAFLYSQSQQRRQP